MLGAELELSPTLKIIFKVDEGTQVDAGQKALIEQLSFWNSIPTVCGMCGSPVHFQTRHPKTFHYYGLVCEGPKPHEMNFGERKEHGSMYVKSDGWQDAYGGGDSNQEEEQPKQAPAQAPKQTVAPKTTSAPATTGSGDGKIGYQMVVAIGREAQKKANISGREFAEAFLEKPVPMLKDLLVGEGEAVMEALDAL